MLERGARVTAVDPTYGVTKNPHGTKLKILGENFECPPGPGGCGQIKVRFTNKNGDRIIISGEHVSDVSRLCLESTAREEREGEGAGWGLELAGLGFHFRHDLRSPPG